MSCLCRADPLRKPIPGSLLCQLKLCEHEQSEQQRILSLLGSDDLFCTLAARRPPFLERGSEGSILAGSGYKLGDRHTSHHIAFEYVRISTSGYALVRKSICSSPTISLAVNRHTGILSYLATHFPANVLSPGQV